MLEIVISESEKILLEGAGFQNVISFCLLLSYGNMKDLENQRDRTIGNLTIPVKSQLTQLEQKKEKQIRIWYSSVDNEDVCTLYFLISYFHGKDIEIFTCDVADKNHFSLGSYSENEIEKLLDRTIHLKESVKQEYHNVWNQLMLEDADLRVLERGILKSVSFEYLDKQMLNILKQYESIRYWAFIGECMRERLCGFFADIIFTTRVDEFIKQGIVEICAVKKEQNGIGEWKDQKYIRIKE